MLTLRIPYPPVDGGSMATYAVIQELTRAGHKVTLLSLNTNKHFQSTAKLENTLEQVIAVPINTELNAKDALMNLLFSKLPYNIVRFLSADFSRVLQRVLKDHTFDIIQLEGVYLALYLDVIRHTTKAPVILRAHNLEYEIWERMANSEKNVLKRWYYHLLAKRGKKFEQRYLNAFDGIVAITAKDADSFRSLGAKCPLTVVEAGVDWEKLHILPQPNPAQTAAFIGSLEWLPNIQGLEWLCQEVWPLVLQQVPRAFLTVAGRNPSAEILSWKKPNIQVVGQVADAIQFLSNHFITVVPLHAGSGMRVKILESMALGRCIISTSIGAEGIDYQDNKNILIADAPEDFAAAIVRMMQNPNQAIEIGKAARKLMQQYDWKRLTQKLVQFYQQTL